MASSIHLPFIHCPKYFLLNFLVSSHFTHLSHDPRLSHPLATCLAQMLPNGSLIGVWRRCETVNLHTVPHALLASDPNDPTTFVT